MYKIRIAVIIQFYAQREPKYLLCFTNLLLRTHVCCTIIIHFESNRVCLFVLTSNFVHYLKFKCCDK